MFYTDFLNFMLFYERNVLYKNFRVYSPSIDSKSVFLIVKVLHFSELFSRYSIFTMSLNIDNATKFSNENHTFANLYLLKMNFDLL